MSTRNETPVGRLLRLLQSNAELLEEIYQQREVYFGAEEGETQHRIGQLRREQIVHVVPDSAGGMTVRLKSHIRMLLNTTNQERRLQHIGVGVTEALEKVDHLAGNWKIAVYEEADPNAEADAHDEIQETLWDIEAQYDDQLEGLQERISTAYGFDDSTAQRARDFKFYATRLIDMVQGANTLVDRLQNDEQYIGIEPIRRIGLQLSTRFRIHGAVIIRLQQELQNYISSARERQAQTRRWNRVQQWLKRQPRPLCFANTEAKAAELSMLHRTSPMNLGGRPNLDDAVMRGTWVEMNQALFKRRKSALDRKAVGRRDSGIVADSSEEEHLAREGLKTQRQRAWQSQAWINDYLRRAILQTKRYPDGKGFSASEYWAERIASVGDEAKPTRRAWLHELQILIVTNRPVGGKRFFKRFQYRTTPSLPKTLQREPFVLCDIRVNARPEALRKHQRSPA